jgi:hypothetical protein
LVRGERYRVIKPFIDADGDVHLAGEEWAFVSAMYSKFDNLLTLCVHLSSGDEWALPLLWKKDKQAEIIEHFPTYVGGKTGKG